MSHADAVEIWQWCETLMFGGLCGSCMMALSPKRKRSLAGFVLLVVIWLVWVVLYRFADGYRNVNAM